MHAVSSSNVYMKISSENTGEKLYGVVVDGGDGCTLHKRMSLSNNDSNNIKKWMLSNWQGLLIVNHTFLYSRYTVTNLQPVRNR